MKGLARQLPAVAWTILFLASGAAAAEPTPAGRLLAGPYAVDPRPDGATVCWQTASEEPGAVRVRSAGAAGWTETAERGRTRFHSVRLAGLAAGTEHRVEILSGPGGAVLGALDLRTAPAGPADFTFFVYGDTQGPPAVHAQATRAALAESRRLGQFAFLLHVGDISGGGDVRSMRRQFFGPAAELLTRLPLVPIRGNHDSDFPAMQSCFPAPARTSFYDETWDFCLDYAGVRLVVLDGNAPGRVRDRRMNWLRDRLAEAGDRWRLVAVHQPLSARGEQADDEYGTGLRALFEPYMVAGRVHAVFSGHHHTYQRSRPIKGVTHFVTGGGGAYDRTPDLKPPEWSAHFATANTFLAVAVSSDRLVVRTLAATAPGSATYAEIDRVEISRDCGWPKVDLASVPDAAVNLDITPGPLRPALLWGGIGLLVLALTIKLARRLRQETA
jgi:Calcineurin-like phosphoesterase